MEVWRVWRQNTKSQYVKTLIHIRDFKVWKMPPYPPYYLPKIPNQLFIIINELKLNNLCFQHMCLCLLVFRHIITSNESSTFAFHFFFISFSDFRLVCLVMPLRFCLLWRFHQSLIDYILEGCINFYKNKLVLNDLNLMIRITSILWFIIFQIICICLPAEIFIMREHLITNRGQASTAQNGLKVAFQFILMLEPAELIPDR